MTLAILLAIVVLINAYFTQCKRIEGIPPAGDILIVDPVYSEYTSIV